MPATKASGGRKKKTHWPSETKSMGNDMCCANKEYETQWENVDNQGDYDRHQQAGMPERAESKGSRVLPPFLPTDHANTYSVTHTNVYTLTIADAKLLKAVEAARAQLQTCGALAEGCLTLKAYKKLRNGRVQAPRVPGSARRKLCGQRFRPKSCKHNHIHRR